MKKNSVLLAATALLASALPIEAAGYKSVTVNLSDNTSVSVNITDDLRFWFSDEEMNIESSTLEDMVKIPRENILGFTHSETSGIDGVETDNGAPVIDGNHIIFSNLGAGSEVRVFDTAGRLVLSRVAEGDLTLSLDSLNSGVYLVNINDVTIKIAVR